MNEAFSEQAIKLFERLPERQQGWVITFMKSLIANFVDKKRSSDTNE